MIIPPSAIDEAGPGIDLTNQPSGISIQMSDPVRDLEYARNAVTLMYDLSGFENVRLLFKAMEYGDEPHEPPASPFGDAVNFDGVAVSGDGALWHEIQSLRSLRSDKFTAFNIDLSGALAPLGLAHGNAVRVRFCQYDDNPAPMDGFSIEGIALVGDARPPVLHLAMDDNGATPTVVDASEGLHDQTFIDPGGDPNTSAHSVPGVVGTALHFDGVDDRIVLSAESYREFLGENHDFAVAFWWKTNAPDPAVTKYVLFNRKDTENSFFAYTSQANMTLAFRFGTNEIRWVSKPWTGGADDAWHHYVFMRKGTVVSVYRDGVLGISDDNPENVLSLAPSDINMTIGATPGGNSASPGFVDDFRVYDRSLFEAEIQELAGAG